ncbi:MAG TPA: hypothetical protein VIL20_29485 [Sandaracinaceae bacterium]
MSTHVSDWRDHVVSQIVVDRFENGDPSNDVIDGIGPSRAIFRASKAVTGAA